MRPLASGIVALLAAGWFAFGAPRVSLLLTGGEHRHGVPQVAVKALRGSSDPVVQAHLAELDRIVRAEETAYRAIATVVSEEQQALGRRLERDLPPIRERSRANTDVVALARALLEVHGYAVLPAPRAGAGDPWPGADPVTQTRSVLALARAEELQAGQAAVILGQVLALLELQVEKARLFDELELFDRS